MKAKPRFLNHHDIEVPVFPNETDVEVPVFPNEANVEVPVFPTEPDSQTKEEPAFSDESDSEVKEEPVDPSEDLDDEETAEPEIPNPPFKPFGDEDVTWEVMTDGTMCNFSECCKPAYHLCDC